MNLSSTLRSLAYTAAWSFFSRSSSLFFFFSPSRIRRSSICWPSLCFAKFYDLLLIYGWWTLYYYYIPSGLPNLFSLTTGKVGLFSVARVFFDCEDPKPNRFGVVFSTGFASFETALSGPLINCPSTIYISCTSSFLFCLCSISFLDLSFIFGPAAFLYFSSSFS